MKKGEQIGKEREKKNGLEEVVNDNNAMRGE